MNKKLLSLALLAAFSLSACNVVNAPANVANKTFETNNIIDSYEWFYDVNAKYETRSSQVKEYSEYLAAESDPKEVARLRMELSAVRQSCRDLVTRYNANSEKANKTLFKSNNLPQTLSIDSCEAH